MQLVGDGAVPAGEGKEAANWGSWAAQWALLLAPGPGRTEEASAQWHRPPLLVKAGTAFSCHVYPLLGSSHEVPPDPVITVPF